MVAHGRAADAEKVLDWAAARGVTVVRVLAMADVLFKLSPDEGRRALPRLLVLARDRRLIVEVVALADTGRVEVDVREQVRAAGAACAAHGNCVLEIANEPWHGTQRRELGDAVTLRGLRQLVPPSVPVSLGSASADDSAAYSGGDYLTVHLDRASGADGWRHVLRMKSALELGQRVGKPVVDDEPIGAAERSVPGRRDSDPTRWLAKGLLARLMDIGATFHYEGGLQSQLPRGREAECFEAWRRGLDALPAGVGEQAVFEEPGSPGAAVASFDRRRALAVYAVRGKREAWAVALRVTGAPAIRWSPGWHAVATRDYGGVRVVTAGRRINESPDHQILR
jgi:hypothetical protein